MTKESADLEWRQRFGEAKAPAFPDFGSFLTHRSVRRFLPDPVPVETVRALIGIAQSASTSSHWQLWSVVSVQDPARREQMAMLCGDQDQVRQAAWFFAFLADHHRLRSCGAPCEALDYAEFAFMAAIDAALAAERLVCAAESIGLGACYIGGLRNQPEGVKDLLGLPLGTFGFFGLCLGWPDPQHLPQIKPRLNQSQVWFRETYGEPTLGEFDERMKPFYEAEGMKPEVTWSMRMSRRVDGHHLAGRERLLDCLKAQGFLHR